MIELTYPVQGMGRPVEWKWRMVRNMWRPLEWLSQEPRGPSRWLLTPQPSHFLCSLTGKFATGTIVRRYEPGSWIPVIVDITTNHGGYFIFKLCPNNDITSDPPQTCFDEHVLEVKRFNASPDVSGAFVQTGKNGERELLVSEELSGPVTLYVKLPDTVTCDQCIIQVQHLTSLWSCWFY